MMSDDTNHEARVKLAVECEGGDLLLAEGYRLCYEVGDMSRGIETLEKAAESGEPDAYYHIGSAFQVQGDYERAAKFFEIGAGKGNVPSSYRLAQLHRFEKIRGHNFHGYLQTMKLLAKHGHIPSKIRYLVDRALLRHGLWNALWAWLIFLPLMFYFVAAAMRNKGGPLMQA